MTKELKVCFYDNYKESYITRGVYLAQKHVQKYDEDIAKIIHVEIFIDNVSYSSSVRTNGVRKRVKDIPENTRVLTYYIEEDKIERVIEFFNSQLGKKYDYVNILLNQILSISIQDDNKWICSELTFEALKIVGVIKPEWLRSTGVSPASLYTILNKDLNHG